VDPSLAAFVPVAALLIVVPGPDVLLVVRNAVRERAAGLATAAGILGGTLVHGAAATVGLSALVAASATAFTVVKVLGAGYLVLLGIQALWASRRRPGAPGVDAPAAPLRVGRAARQGFLTNVLNPKVAVFFVAFLPQFVPVGGSVAASTALLAGLFAAMTAVYLPLLVVLTGRAAALLARPVARRLLDRVAGVVFIGFGVRLAAATR
jgi:threonine/homoserine/homoserine lactone efflux protein